MESLRPLCPLCKARPVGINYYKDDVVHYRSLCIPCYRKGKKLKPQAPKWFKLGYRKKPACERCGFKFKLVEQANVFHLDGDLTNCDWANLKTICLNCTAEVYKSKLPWKSSTIVPDF